jgi:hypothetical protein
MALSALVARMARSHEPVHGRVVYAPRPVTVRNIAKSIRAYVRGERRHGLPHLGMRVECDAPNAPNMRGRQRLGEWYQ